MNSVVLVVVGGGVLLFGYSVYSRILMKHTFIIDANKPTPAHRLRDDIDYMPTNRHVLFGHHFASIAGLMPIYGPAVAVIWGWLPAFLWVILGCVFMGAVHDFGALYISVRSDGHSIGDIAGSVVSKRSRTIFLLVIFFFVGLAMGLFVLLITKLLIDYPKAVIPTGSLMIIAIGMGIAIYRYGAKLLPASVIGIVLMFFTVYLGVKSPGIEFENPEVLKVILLIYAYIASVLPVWLLLQPRDYLNAFELYIGVGLIFLGVLVAHPQISAPAINTPVFSDPDALPIFPFLFVIVACGAISGFHTLISTGTSPKQINSERDEKMIGYGSMILEGFLALAAILACTAGLGGRAEWLSHYGNWAQANAGKLGTFVKGASYFISSLGIMKLEFAEIFVATVAVAFALTTLDSATRLLRYNISEMGEMAGLKFFRSRFVAAFFAVLWIGYFAFIKVGGKQTAVVLLGVFGTTNQLLAALTLITVSLYLYRRRRPTLYTAIPMLIMLTITIWAMLYSLINFFRDQQYILIFVGLSILLLALWLIVEGIVSLININKQRERIEAQSSTD